MKLSVFLEKLNQIAKDNPEALNYTVGIYVTTSYDGETDFLGIESITEGKKVKGWLRDYFSEQGNEKDSILLDA